MRGVTGGRSAEFAAVGRCATQGQTQNPSISFGRSRDRHRIRRALDEPPSPARENAFRESLDNAFELMRRIDARFPSTDGLGRD
jgi:hypothetical protein